MTRFTIAACIVLFAVNASSAKDEKMTLEVYYDSDCKGSQRLFDEEIGRLLGGPCFDAIKPVFVPYANVQEHKLATGPGAPASYNYTCQHGVEECKKNKLQLCSLDAMKTMPQRDQGDALMCLEQPPHGCPHHHGHHHHHHHHHHKRALRQEGEPSNEEDMAATDAGMKLTPVDVYKHPRDPLVESEIVTSSPYPHHHHHEHEREHAEHEKKPHPDDSPASRALHHCLHRQKELVPQIQACMNGTKGDELMHAAAEKVKALGNKPYAPFIRINSKVLSPSAYDDLKQAICVASGHKCRECCAPPPWYIRWWRSIIDFFVYIFHFFHHPPPRPPISKDLCLLHPNKTMTHKMTIIETFPNGDELVITATE